jgi:hypothetical protein
MHRLLSAVSLALGLLSSALHAAPPSDAEAAIRRELKTLQASAEAPQPGPAGNVDLDRFGRNSRYLGLMYSGILSMERDCSSPDVPKGPDDRCIGLPADSAQLTTFELPDIGRMTLPARSTNSLLCHWLTLNGYYALENTGTARVNARMYLRPYAVIESAALADPALIDPNTGLPFGGRLESSFSGTHLDQRSLDPGEYVGVADFPSRTCQAGLSRRYLVGTYGLTEAQAAAVMRGEITLRFGLRGSVRAVAGASFLYGLRMMGD